MERGARLQRFLTLLEKGTDQKQAFIDAIGEFKPIEEQLNRYLDGKELDAFVFNNPSILKDDDISLRRLSPAQANAESATAAVWLHENAAARARLEQPLKAKPS